MSTLESYHAFLIRQRRYCEYYFGHHICNDLATTVRNINGRDTVLCSEHAGRLDAVRQSDRKQEVKLEASANWDCQPGKRCRKDTCVVCQSLAAATKQER